MAFKYIIWYIESWGWVEEFGHVVFFALKLEKKQRNTNQYYMNVSDHKPRNDCNECLGAIGFFEL
jgi:hypothetical protein